MKNPKHPKERNLLKGAIRRVYSRSESRKAVIDKNLVKNFNDPSRPRVTKWVFCNKCGLIFPKYLAEADHIEPIVPLDKALEDMSWDELIDNLWCDIEKQSCLCKVCHKTKTKEENRKRNENKKVRRRLV